jgi:hypothetical protein
MTDGLYFRLFGPLRELQIDVRAGQYILNQLSSDERRCLASFLRDLQHRSILAGVTIGHGFWLFNVCHHILAIRVITPGHGIVTRVYPDTLRRHQSSMSGPSSSTQTKDSQPSSEKSNTPTDFHAEPKTSESAIIQSAGVVAGAAAAAGAVNVIRNIVGIVKDSFDIKKHIQENAQNKGDKLERKEEQANEGDNS